jgi:polysaccharide export outer membrane protein
MKKKIISLTIIAVMGLVVCGATMAQSSNKATVSKLEETRPRTVTNKGADGATARSEVNPADGTSPADEAAIQTHINLIYQSFYNSYRLGPGDVLGIFIDKQPQDSAPKVVVSPVGYVYFPLLGNVPVVGKTLPQLEQYFTVAVAEFIRDPRVTLTLLEAHSAKIGVLGDVKTPGVKIMTRPMRVLDAITEAGGILETGSQNVSILRQYEDGRVQVFTSDVKKILKGKASPEENAYLRAGDTVIVHGNLFKKMTKISSVVGVTSLITFLSRGGR